VERAIAAVQQTMQAVRHRPLFVVVGLDNGTVYGDAVSVVQAQYPEKVQWVLPGQLVQLARQAWEQGMDRAAPLGTPAAHGVRDTYFLLTAGDDGSGSSVGNYLRAGVVSLMRQATGSGGWTYAFNVEGCRRASLEAVLTGTGSVQASTDGRHWRELGRSAVAWGAFVVLTADLSSLLPATFVYLRFGAASGQTFGCLDLNLWHNRVLTGATLPAAMRTASSQELGMTVPQANPSQVSLVLGTTGGGLNVVQVGAHEGDSEFHVATVAGKSAEVFDPNTASPGSTFSYLYFTVNVPGWVFPQTVYLTVTYYDGPAGGQLQVNYDAVGSGLGAYYATPYPTLTMTGSGQWKQASWALTDAAFQGRENFAADFRLAGTPGVAVHEVALSLSPVGG